MLSRLTLALLAILFAVSASAQQHIARRLGHPATRFADPLKTSSDLRARLSSEKLKADIASILRQAHWQGDVEDLRRAVLTAEIKEVRLPVGTRLRYMSTRENGKPAVLWDLLWAGDEPIAAYSFDFVSKGQRYRCVTPKACSNFWVEDMGPAVLPGALRLVQSLPAKVRLCDPIEVSLVVENTGKGPVNRVLLTDTASSSGLVITNQQNPWSFEFGPLQPGESRRFTIPATATAPGKYSVTAKAVSADGLKAEQRNDIQITQPVLELRCQTTGDGKIGRPVTGTFIVRNTGDAPENKVTLTLPVPLGIRLQNITPPATPAGDAIMWELGTLQPGESRECSVMAFQPESGDLVFDLTLAGDCSPPVQTRCETRISGIPAILLEVIDLDDPIEIGKDERYEIKVINQGSVDATGIKLTCRLEDSQEWVSAKGPTEAEGSGSVFSFLPLAVLAPKAEAVWQVTVKALKAGDVRFAVELGSDQIDRDVHETEATYQY